MDQTDSWKKFFWSARFFCAAIMGTLGIALLVGGLMFVSYGGADSWYYAALGALLWSDGMLLLFRARAGLMGYVAVLAAACAWTLYEWGLNLWQLMPHLGTLLFWGAILFVLRHRISPTRDCAGSPVVSIRDACRRGWRLIRALSTEQPPPSLQR
jgi:glucose dehydrogenase